MSSVTPDTPESKVDIQKKSQQVAILDAGAQYAKVIDRRVRELMVESHILPLDTPASELSGYGGIIVSGGPQSVFGKDAPAYDPKIFGLGVPLFGVCYGMQLLNYVHGGSVESKTTREDGQFSITQTKDSNSELFHGLPESFRVLLTHGDSVDKVAKGFSCIARSSEDIVVAIEDAPRKLYGVQFHPEVDLSEYGKELFANFLFRVCKLEGKFTMENRQEKAIREIRDHVGDCSVLVLVSGGVDSSVCAALLHEALPSEKIHCLHVDNGFMRYEESKRVSAALEKIGLKVHVLRAAKRFAASTLAVGKGRSLPLCKTLKPEVKRKIIGNMFMEVSEDHVKGLNLNLNECYLCQGTLRPDLIESASNIVSANADVIKTHHNDTAMVRSLRDLGRIVEPLKDLHKDEVRQLGTQLGLPTHLVWRQPFPGPGLAIRVICAEEPFLPDALEDALKKLAPFKTESTSVTLLPCRTVGVQGDQRSYRSVVGLSCKGKPDWASLFAMAKAIPKRVHEVNRVVFMFGKPEESPCVRTVTPTTLTPDVIEQLQRADDVVNEVLLKYKLTRVLSQVPVILFPVDFGKKGYRSICIRTFVTNDFMTGCPATPGGNLPLEALDEMVKAVTALPGIARVCFDLTAKPPGTTEWE